MKDNINLPPFYVGQRVVALRDRKSKDGSIEKGKEYIVLDLSVCKKCGAYSIDVGIRTATYGLTDCVRCDMIQPLKTNRVYAAASLFAPIESTFSAITLSEVIEIETPLICNN